MHVSYSLLVRRAPSSSPLTVITLVNMVGRGGRGGRREGEGGGRRERGFSVERRSDDRCPALAFVCTSSVQLYSIILYHTLSYCLELSVVLSGDKMIKIRPPGFSGKGQELKNDVQSKSWYCRYDV